MRHPFAIRVGTYACMHVEQGDRLRVVRQLETMRDARGLRQILDTADEMRTQRVVIQRATAALRRLERQEGRQ